MTPEQEQYLFHTYPELYWDRRTVERYDCSPYIFGFAVGPGWFDIIVELSEKLLPLARKHNEACKDYNFRVDQIKEKFGGLRFYVGGVVEPYFDDVYKAIEEAETLSYVTCEECGKPGKLRNDLGWILTLCNEHYETIKKHKFREEEDE